MHRRQTPLEVNFPVPADFMILARLWRSDAIDILLDFIWKGLDRLKGKNYTFNPDQENIEREITQLLEPEIREVMSGLEPYYIQHGPFESQTRKPAPAQPPQYDLGFVLRTNRRAIWPIEAKVLKTDGTVSEYVKDVQESYLSAVYSPFSSEAAMLGYLLHGDPANALARIAEALACQLSPHPSFSQRDHKTSQHARNIDEDKPYPSTFKCNHIMVFLGNE